MGPAAVVAFTQEGWISQVLRMVQYTFQNCTETPYRGAIGSFSNIPDLKKNIL